jgi:hypothetical protein
MCLLGYYLEELYKIYLFEDINFFFEELEMEEVPFSIQNLVAW